MIGGYLAGSLAVMTDAAHLMSDFVGFLVSLFAIWMARWPPNKNLQFGYHRAGEKVTLSGDIINIKISKYSTWLDSSTALNSKKKLNNEKL